MVSSATVSLFAGERPVGGDRAARSGSYGTGVRPDPHSRPAVVVRSRCRPGLTCVDRFYLVLPPSKRRKVSWWCEIR